MEATLAAMDPHRRKELGAFYTPPAITGLLAGWAIRSAHDTVLDPSFGNLAFLRAAAQRLRELGLNEASVGAHLRGIEVDPAAFDAARGDSNLRIPESNLLYLDFFDAVPEQAWKVDVVLGNPPYIRYQGFRESRERARKAAAVAGVKLTGLASSWAAFVVHGSSFLKPGGHMAQVLPAEILHAQYAEEVLAFLERSFRSVVLATFEDRIFPGALEEVVLLFADGYGTSDPGSVHVASFANLETLKLEGLAMKRQSGIGRRGRSKLVNQLLPSKAQDLLEELAPEVSELGSVASVDIGIVTGANAFFALPASEVSQLPPEVTRRGVSKARHVTGARLDEGDHERLAEDGQPVYLLIAELADGERSEGLAAHIRWGEDQGFNFRYKCRIRDPWWSLSPPRGGPPDLLLTYCSNEYPRLAANAAGVIQTNTIHGVRVREGVSSDAFAVAFYNSLTLLSAELEGRSYGGGVLKLEPTEAERLLLPAIRPDLADALPSVDAAIRAGDLDRATALVDRVLLVDGLGVSKKEVSVLRRAREQLRKRRKRRGRRAV